MIKSTIRQPIRSLIFMLLVGLASFGFVSRYVEFTILNTEINRVEAFYRRVGSLTPVDPVNQNNVYAVAQLLEGSPLISFVDTRPIVQGEVDGVMNANRGHWLMNTVYGPMQFYAYKGLDIFDMLAMVRVESIHARQHREATETGFQVVQTQTVIIDIDEVLVGHDDVFLDTRNYMVEFSADGDGNWPLMDMEVGEYYLVRIIPWNAHFYNSSAVIFPLFPGGDVYYINARDTAGVEAAFAYLADEIKVLNANNQSLMVTGTKDMSALPLVMSGLYQRFHGRFIGYEDYINRNPVAVVPLSMDRRVRDARVGETITLTLRNMQTFESGSPRIGPAFSHHPWYGGGWPEPALEGQWRNIPAGYWTAIPRGYTDFVHYDYITIDVEVIGTYRVPEELSPPRWNHIRDSFQNIEVFVPASIIPEGFGLVDAHVVTGQFSFVLRDPMYDIRFMERYGERLEYLGFTVDFLGEDPTNFILSAVPIRNSIYLNLVLFTTVLVLVLMLTAFVYLKQRYKDFAIMRALGVSGKKALWQGLLPVLCFWVPVAVVASVLAWFFAIHQSVVGLETLALVDTPTDYAAPFIVRNILDQARYDAEQLVIRVTPSLSIWYLIGSGFSIVLAWILVVFAGFAYFANSSMISLLQGANNGGAGAKTVKEVPVDASSIKMADLADILGLRPKVNGANRVKSALRHHMRHIVRGPVKTALIVMVALLFVISLGWLNHTITVTEQEIERLYDTTVITGRLQNPRINPTATAAGHAIPMDALQILVDSPYIFDIYTTSITDGGILRLLPAITPEMEENFDLVFSNSLPRVPHHLKTINNFENFAYYASLEPVFGMAVTSPFWYEFLEGYGPEDFTIPFGAENPRDYMPIILHESLFWSSHFLVPYARMIADGAGNYHFTGTGRDIAGEIRNADGSWGFVSHQLGDMLYLAVTAGADIPVRIVGVYGGGHPAFAYFMNRGLIIASHLHDSTWDSVEFTVCQSRIRDLPDMVAYFDDQLHMTTRIAGTNFVGERVYSITQTTHLMDLNDAEFRVVIMPLEENLNLLRILYPVAIVLSFVMAAGLSFLLMLQNGKNVAILLVLGDGRLKLRFNLGLELMAVCMVGLVTGFATVVLGIGIPGAVGAMLAGVYFAGALAGAVVGVVVISYKTPLELLQVRE